MTKNKIVKIITDDGSDLVEPFLDEGVSRLMKSIFGTVLPEIAKEVPILRSIQTVSDVYGVIRLTRLSNRMNSFAKALQLDDFDLDDLNKLPKDEQLILIDTVVTELDNHTDNLQSEALGYLFKAYVSGKIDRLSFTGIAHELKNSNPLIFYFNVDGYAIEQPPKLPPFPASDVFAFTASRAGTVIKSGPVDYLPAAFKSNGGGNMQFSTEIMLTNLGEIFIKHVYEPMREENII